MKKFFLFAAAAIAALTVNAKVITFAEIVDNSSADAAKAAVEEAFDLTNITVKGVANSAGDSYLAEIRQTEATTEWEITNMALKSDNQAYFTFKDSNNDKLVMKAYKEYVQPNGKAVCLVITDLTEGDKVTLTLKKALDKETFIEGATVTTDRFASDVVELTAAGEEIRIYSKNEAGSADAKWQLISIEIGGSSEGVENVEATVKATKAFENGQLVIIKNNVRYNALGAQL